MAASKQKLRTRSPSLQWFWIQDDVFIRSRVVYSRAVLVPSLDCRLTKFKSFKVSSFFIDMYPALLAWNLLTNDICKLRLPLALELRWNGWYLADKVQSGHVLWRWCGSCSSTAWHQWCTKRFRTLWQTASSLIFGSHLRRSNAIINSCTGICAPPFTIFFSNLAQMTKLEFVRVKVHCHVNDV